jgi:hypothetical protein
MSKTFEEKIIKAALYEIERLREQRARLRAALTNMLEDDDDRYREGAIEMLKEEELYD